MSRTCVSLARVPISRARLGQYRHTGRGVALCLSDGEVERRFRAWRGGTGAPPPFGTAGAAARRSGDPAQAPIAPQTAIAFQTVARPAPFHPSIRPAHAPPTTVAHNGYRYRIDGTGRTMAVTGALMLDPDQPRSRTAQAAAGGADRRATDDGGHYIAARFGGPGETYNHFAQDAQFNRGAYRLLENRWAAAARSGDRVFVDISPDYVGACQRPVAIRILCSINGKIDRHIFANAPQRPARGPRRPPRRARPGSTADIFDLSEQKPRLAG